MVTSDKERKGNKQGRKKRKKTIQDDGQVSLLDCGNHFIVHMYIKTSCHKPLIYTALPHDLHVCHLTWSQEAVSCCYLGVINVYSTWRLSNQSEVFQLCYNLKVVYHC